jgi:hypothetical protein
MTPTNHQCWHLMKPPKPKTQKPLPTNLISPPFSYTPHESPFKNLDNIFDNVILPGKTYFPMISMSAWDFVLLTAEDLCKIIDHITLICCHQLIVKMIPSKLAAAVKWKYWCSWINECPLVDDYSFFGICDIDPI